MERGGGGAGGFRTNLLVSKAHASLDVSASPGEYTITIGTGGVEEKLEVVVATGSRSYFGPLMLGEESGGTYSPSGFGDPITSTGGGGGGAGHGKYSNSRW